MITGILEFVVRLLVSILDVRDAAVDWFQYVGEEIRNEGKDWASLDTQELRQVPVSRALRTPYNTRVGLWEGNAAT